MLSCEVTSELASQPLEHRNETAACKALDDDDLLFYLEQEEHWHMAFRANQSGSFRRAGISLPPPPATWDFIECLDHFRLILP